MATAFASAARFVAFVGAAPTDRRDIEDLHEADQDAVLRDRSAEGYGAAAAAHLVGQPGRAALLAHELSSRAALLLR
ncbi:MAG TPA: hypothetical protein VGD12_08995 [Blastococcus sp.]|jgi:hypothetical protein